MSPVMSTRTFSSSTIITCICHKPYHIYSSHREESHRRKFYRSTLISTPIECNSFRWIDESDEGIVNTFQFVWREIDSSIFHKISDLESKINVLMDLNILIITLLIISFYVI